MMFNWLGQIGEIGMAVGIIALTAIFNLGGEDPIKRIRKVPMCRVECVVQSTLEAPFGEVVCAGKTEDVWNDFVVREVAKSEHSYCGACGSPVSCETVRFR